MKAQYLFKVVVYFTNQLSVSVSTICVVDGGAVVGVGAAADLQSEWCMLIGKHRDKTLIKMRCSQHIRLKLLLCRQICTVESRQLNHYEEFGCLHALPSSAPGNDAGESIAARARGLLAW